MLAFADIDKMIKQGLTTNLVGQIIVLVGNIEQKAKRKTEVGKKVKQLKAKRDDQSTLWSLVPRPLQALVQKVDASKAV